MSAPSTRSQVSFCHIFVTLLDEVIIDHIVEATNAKMLFENNSTQAERNKFTRTDIYLYFSMVAQICGERCETVAEYIANRPKNYLSKARFEHLRKYIDYDLKFFS